MIAGQGPLGYEVKSKKDSASFYTSLPKSSPEPLAIECGASRRRIYTHLPNYVRELANNWILPNDPLRTPQRIQTLLKPYFFEGMKFETGVRLLQETKTRPVPERDPHQCNMPAGQVKFCSCTTNKASSAIRTPCDWTSATDRQADASKAKTLP